MSPKLYALLNVLSTALESEEGASEDREMEKKSIYLPRIGAEKRASIFMPRIGTEKRGFYMPRVGKSLSMHMPRIGK